MSASSNAVCSIFAKNYAASARTLFQSFRAHNPGVRCFGLVIDDWQGVLKPEEEPYEIVSLGDVGIPDLKRTTFKYDITELATAAKPFLLERLLCDHGIDRLLYLDPDIMVTGGLTDLFERLDEADFLVTPHLDQDFPDDGKLPDDKVILTSGIYNLGFFGLRRNENAWALLRWWQHKLKTKCVMDHAAGYFVDQRFIDLAMGLFPGFGIVRDPGYNAAYWNLHSRTLSQTDGRWLCNGAPLSFYHFSGYSPKRPTSISKHINRYSLDDRPDLRPLFQAYHAQVLANGHEIASRWPYTHGTYATGEAIEYVERRFYREWDGAAERVPDPFQSAIGFRKVKRAVEAQQNPFSFYRATRRYLGTVRRGWIG